MRAGPLSVPELASSYGACPMPRTYRLASRKSSLPDLGRSPATRTGGRTLDLRWLDERLLDVVGPGLNVTVSAPKLLPEQLTPFVAAITHLPPLFFCGERMFTQLCQCRRTASVRGRCLRASARTPAQRFALEAGMPGVRTVDR